MLKIDWDGVMDFWNGVFNTEYTLHKVMLKAAYKEFPSILILADKLDVNSETLRRKLHKEGIKLKVRGKGNKKVGKQNRKKRKNLKQKEGKNETRYA